MGADGRAAGRGHLQCVTKASKHKKRGDRSFEADAGKTRKNSREKFRCTSSGRTVGNSSRAHPHAGSRKKEPSPSGRS